MRLKEWAAQEGINYQTAYRGVREGLMPVPVRRVGINGKTILVDVPITDVPVPAVGFYACVSSSDQREDLNRQMDRLSALAFAGGMNVVRSEAEICSGLNDSRAKVRRMLADPAVNVIVVEHRERLGRMNIGLVEAALAAAGRKLVVLDSAEVSDDLVRDMTEVLTSFCARLYGRRSARNRTAAALSAAAASPSEAVRA
ncbi:IS607 family transposase [Pseudarthrobacter sp. Y6]|uniref:IS607 family transposase n=1 Tax=Pseudarthrobacter sp. Y6 TaxID=3418422 RepID=UPI003CF59AF9